MLSKICDLSALERVVQIYRQKGLRVGATSGCFDILHAGHVTYLEEAKSLCDVLIVLLNSDLSVRKLKGSSRPILGQEDRAVVLASLESVNLVCIFEEDTPCSIYEKLKPDIVVKGGDYEGMHIPEMDTVANYGGQVEFLSLRAGRSTTDIIERIKKLAGKGVI